MLPRLGVSKLVSVWLALTIVASLASALDGGWLASWLALEPRQIFHGEVWRLATWALIQPVPITVVVTSLAIFKLGGDLAAAWSDARLRRYALAMILLGGVATSLVALATGDATIAITDSFGVLDALGIAWVRQFPQGTLSWFGVEFRGPARLVLILGVNVALALAFGVGDFLPELAICAGAMLYPS